MGRTKKPRDPLELVQPEPPFRQDVFRPQGWSFDVPVAIDSDGNHYWPINVLADWLGIDRKTQRYKVRTNARFASYIHFYILNTGAGGRQPMWTLREDRVGKWLDTIDEANVREHLQERLHEFQEAITAYADFQLRGPRAIQPRVQTFTAEETQAIEDPVVRSALRKMGLDLDMLKFAFLQQNERMGRLERQFGLLDEMGKQLGTVQLSPTTLIGDSTDEADEDDE